MARRLHISLRPGHALSRSELEELWAVRRRGIELRSEIDAQADFAHFADILCQSVVVGRVLDPQGRARGMLAIRASWETYADRRYRLLLPEYSFVDRQYRGHPTVAFMFLRILLAVVRVRSRAPHLLGGFGYPTSFMRRASWAPPLYIDGDPELPGLIAHALERIIDIVAGDARDAQYRYL